MEKPDLNTNQENISNESQSESNFVEIKNELLEASQKIDEDIEKRKNIESNKEKEIRNTLEETLDKEANTETLTQRIESTPVKPEITTEKQSNQKPTEVQKINTEVKGSTEKKKDEKKISTSGGGSGSSSGFMSKIKGLFGKLFSPFAFVGNEITKLFAVKPTEKKK